MKILYLKSNNQESDKLEAYLRGDGNEVISHMEKITPDIVLKLMPDIIVSYNYRFILKSDVISIPKMGVINLHVSYLPWNRGADPNFWSHVEGTPKGVTVHYIDPGIDTGDIITQKKVIFSEKDTLSTSYAKLHKEIQDLFYGVWPDIKKGKNSRIKQSGEGTAHWVKDRAEFDHLMKNGWNTLLSDLQIGLKHESAHKKPQM